MTDTSQNSSVAPPALEQLGALCSLLIHDLANQLCIISSGATFAQMVLAEPERLAGSLKSIIHAAENAGHTLSSCGELRRALPDKISPSKTVEVLRQIHELTLKEPGWSFENHTLAEGRVRLPAVWSAFAVSCLIKEIRATGGTIRASRHQEIVSSHDVGFEPEQPAPPRSYLRIALAYQAESPFQMKEARTRCDHLGLLAAFELNRCLGGRLESQTLSTGRQEIQLDLAMTTDDS